MKMPNILNFVSKRVLFVMLSTKTSTKTAKKGQTLQNESAKRQTLQVLQISLDER